MTFSDVLNSPEISSVRESLLHKLFNTRPGLLDSRLRKSRRQHERLVAITEAKVQLAVSAAKPNAQSKAA